MRIEVNNRQRKHKVNAQGVRALVRFFMDRARKSVKSGDWGEISVVIVDEDEIRLLNERHLGRNESTDVLSFRYAPMPGDNGVYDGEIIVNVERAIVEGSRRAGAPREMGLYLAHSCDHLMGMEDLTRAGRLAMRRRELRWLKQAEKCRLLNKRLL